MDQQLRDMLKAAGMDVDGTLLRFMENESLFIKFIKKFPRDSTYLHLKEGYEEEDADKIFLYSHTLKGVSANLGLQRIYEDVLPVVEAARRKEMPAGSCMEKLESDYQAALNVIDKI